MLLYDNKRFSVRIQIKKSKWIIYEIKILGFHWINRNRFYLHFNYSNFENSLQNFIEGLFNFYCSNPFSNFSSRDAPAGGMNRSASNYSNNMHAPDMEEVKESVKQVKFSRWPLMFNIYTLFVFKSWKSFYIFANDYSGNQQWHSLTNHQLNVI